MRASKVERKLRKRHHARLVRGRHTAHIGGHVRKHNIHRTAREVPLQFREDGFLSEVASQLRYASEGREFEEIEGVHLTAWGDRTGRDLRPSAGRRAEIDHRHPRGEQLVARPDLLEPSSTAREIAALQALPNAARGAFASIAELVERSLFALRRLSADDWQAARAAYAEFALAAPQAA